MLNPTLTPTAEQASIIAFSLSSKESLVINALAGSAKTTTLEMICRALPVQPILSLAFNRRIAEEMKKRLPGHVNVSTINALGHKIWAQATAKRLILKADKVYLTLKEEVEKLRGEAKASAYDAFTDMKRAISAAKLNGYVPKGTFPQAKRLLTQDEFYSSFDDDFSSSQIALIEKTLTRSISDAYSGTIDFDDQIYLPTLFGGTFPRFPLVLVDEAQDLSPLNHHMLEKLVTNRLIAVGDPFQSIYAFRGAATRSMAKLTDRFNCTEMTLSVSFRCPVEIVKRAQTRAPGMRWADTAIDGEVKTPGEWNAGSIPEGAAIICRNNAPLFKLGFALLRGGRGINLVGFDVGPGLIRILKKLGPESASRSEVLAAIAKWEAAGLTKSRAKASVRDRADALRVFAAQGETLSAAIAYAEHIFQAKGPIQLMSGHKSKGLEFDVVFHLDPDRIPSPYAETVEELEQEWNLNYVITTRAKRELWLVKLEDFQDA